jgi:hypothetical protein
MKEKILEYNFGMNSMFVPGSDAVIVWNDIDALETHTDGVLVANEDEWVHNMPLASE